MIEPQDYRSLTQPERRQLREQYARVQGGRCAHCNEPLTGAPAHKVAVAPIRKDLFPKSMFDYPVHLHHNHTTGLTIGAVHARCNAWLWQYKGE